MTAYPITTTERSFKARCRNRGLSRFVVVRHGILKKQYLHASDDNNCHATLITDLVTGHAFTLAAWLYTRERKPR